MDPIFLTDGLWRKTVAAVRSLGRRGIPVHVGERTRLAPALWSRYTTGRHLYPSVRYERDAFLERLRAILDRERIRVLFPMEEETLVTVMRRRDALGDGVIVPFADAETIERARDKARFFQAIESLGVPMPRTWYPQNRREVEEVAQTAPFPLVIKPRIGTGALGVHYVRTADELPRLWTKVHAGFPRPLVQEFIPSESAGYGVSVLIGPQRERLASFVHKRLREYPVSGGASTLRVSVRHPEMLAITYRILEALDWYGIAMAEFRIDARDGLPKVIELNPRFWGSLNLAIQSGVDFPYLLYRMALGERVEPVHDYREGVIGRWLLQGDLMHYLANPERRRMDPGFWQFRGPDWHYDIVSWRDPLPMIVTVLSATLLLHDPELRRFLKR